MTSDQKQTRETVLEAALERIRRYCTTAAFGGWRHDIVRIVDEALDAAAGTEAGTDAQLEPRSFVTMEEAGNGMVRLRADFVVPLSAGAEVLHVLGMAGARPDPASPEELSAPSPVP